MGYASGRLVKDKFYGGRTAKYFTDGGFGYAPINGWHVKWHVDSNGVFDRFHVTNERTEDKVYYLLSRNELKYTNTHPEGREVDWRYWDRFIGNKNNNFDYCAETFQRSIEELVTNSYRTVADFEADYKSDSNKQVEQGRSLNDYMRTVQIAINAAKRTHGAAAEGLRLPLPGDPQVYEKIAEIKRKLELLDPPPVSSSTPPTTPPGYVLGATAPGGPMIYMTDKRKEAT